MGLRPNAKHLSFISNLSLTLFFITSLISSLACGYTGALTTGFDSLEALALVVDMSVLGLLLSCATFKSSKTAWFGSKRQVTLRSAPFFKNHSYALWRPYFKKDGYYGLFTESSLWK